MLDIQFIRDNFELVEKNLEKRRNPEYLKMLKDVKKFDDSWRKCKAEVDQLRSRRNKVSQEINAAKKAGKKADKFIKEAKEIPGLVEKQEKKMDTLHNKMTALLMRIPNLLDDSVPYGASDEDNKEVEQFGKKPKFTFKPVSHVDLLEKYDLADLERAAKISGSRWYFLKNELVILDHALQRYAIDFMVKRGFTPVVPPFLVDRRAVETATSLDDFEEAIYSVKEDDLYLVATSEHPLAAMWRDEVIDEKCLPIKMVGFSTNFRKEAGSHGKDTKGIFRVHQFNKIEQFVVCRPEDSWAWHEALFKNAKELIESLGIHCRVVVNCTGDLGIVAAKKYDIEGWFPCQDAYKELVSCINCTSYQAVRGNIRFQDGNDRKWVHTLNSTCFATSRIMVAILENFQKKGGTVEIPKVLQSYCGFKTIPRKK